MVKDNILHAQYSYWCEVLLALRQREVIVT